MNALEAREVVRIAPMSHLGREGIELFIDAARGNWIGTDARGADILRLLDGSRPLSDVVTEYSRSHNVMPHESHQHVATFIGHLLRRGLAFRGDVPAEHYEGRATRLPAPRLRELWVHTNNSCNLQCAHCLVSSGPEGDRGLGLATLRRLINDALKLGVEQFFFTGGEPFVRRDIFELIAHVTPHARLIVLTNGLLLGGKRREKLRACDRERLGLQISLDGADAAGNDPIRGAGTFEGICDGIRAAVADGFHVVVTTAVCRKNMADVPRITKLVAALGIKNHHLLWPHRRGRAAELPDEYGINAEEALDVLRRARKAAAEAGIVVDNWESFRMRVGSATEKRFDLSNAGYESLCVYSDGQVYPSAALANVQDLRCGSVLDQPLHEIWDKSRVLVEMRALTVVKKPACSECPIRFICGGGDIEHSHAHAAEGSGVARMTTLDPYCELYRQSYYDAMEERCHEYNGLGRTGFHRPVPYYGRGDGLKVCHEDDASGVALARSTCVLSVDLDAARQPVRAFYSNAAEKPQMDLCCPVAYPREDTSHIPKEVMDVFYGCGSPVAIAGVAAGETIVDLGSGGGIDCFIAAKKVGPTGRVIGVDMTDAMIEKARRNNEIVGLRLGYQNVEFRKGFLESIPLDASSANLVLSNCVINLSPDKRRVFREMWRVLKDLGRIVVSDIVADRRVPVHLEQDAEFRGQCLGGALTQEDLLAELERAGFYGLALLEKTFWKEVHGIRFFSIAVRGFKFEKNQGCRFVGQWAVYLGPYQSVMDEEGHLFPRNEAVEVCTDTATRLSANPYKDQFVLFDGESRGEFRSCAPGGACC